MEVALSKWWNDSNRVGSKVGTTRNTFRFQFCHPSATLLALLFHSMPWHTHLFSGVDEGCFDQSMTHACNLCCLLAGVASIIAASGLSCKELCHTSMWEGMGVFSFLHYKYIVRCHPTVIFQSEGGNGSGIKFNPGMSRFRVWRVRVCFPWQEASEELEFRCVTGLQMFQVLQRPEGLGDAWCSPAMFRVVRRWACAACVMSYPGLRWLCGCGSTLWRSHWLCWWLRWDMPTAAATRIRRLVKWVKCDICRERVPVNLHYAVLASTLLALSRTATGTEPACLKKNDSCRKRKGRTGKTGKTSYHGSLSC